jgi:hypothetical protein
LPTLEKEQASSKERPALRSTWQNRVVKIADTLALFFVGVN